MPERSSGGVNLKLTFGWEYHCSCSGWLGEETKGLAATVSTLKGKCTAFQSTFPALSLVVMWKYQRPSSVSSKDTGRWLVNTAVLSLATMSAFRSMS